MRNIGISAHIDSGKTTLTERILFYTKRIHKMHEVKGKDGVGATMDSMDLERERGITIASAATYCSWKDYYINIIDTPGHVDFTIEVERSLRVLDGAVLVLCAVAGVQSQSITVDRQMRRYGVPRIAFINKCDRTGANPFRVTDQLRSKLRHNAVLMQLPIGLEGEHAGVIDLVRMKGYLFEGDNGETIREIEIPVNQKVEAEARREEMLDALSMHNDALMEAALEGKVTEELIRETVRRATIERQITPVFLGSAYKNRGVQLLLDAVIEYLPDPSEVRNEGILLDNGAEKEPFVVETDAAKPLVALAFKLEVSPFGQLTYLRIYQGSLRKGNQIVNSRSHERLKVGRLVRMHADSMEDIEEAEAGDIVAMFGIDCASGDTFTDGRIEASMAPIHVPEPVVSLAIKPVDNKAQNNMSRALQRFTKEDPTFRTGTDEETGDTLISGMGELHLEVYVERMKREYNAEVSVGRPKVAYREALTRAVNFDYTHKKQTGGAGQYAKIQGRLEPRDEGGFEFVNQVIGGNIPTEFVSSVEKGFRSCLERGEWLGYPIAGLRVLLQDGGAHAVDSSDNAFQAAARGAFREYYVQANPVALEPIMKVSVEGPSEYQGDIMGTLMKRRGTIQGATEEQGFIRIDADVPLAEMFGYATVLRSATQGKAEFTMEFSRYGVAPADVTAELRKAWLEKRAAGK
jgi:elongation factor G